jgi:uncharacterized protein (DUF58 family)
MFRKNKEPAPKSSGDNADIREAGRAPLSEVAKKVKRIEIVTGRQSTAHLSGQYRSRFRGQGVQFSDFRVYQFGDDIRHIDWRTSAKTEDTYVKKFEEERELNIMLAADISPSLGFGSQGQSKEEIMCLALATIAFSAAINNDRVGLILFTEEVERYIPPKKGRKHVLRLIDELLTFKPKGNSANLTSALRVLEKVTKQNSTVVVASDFFVSLDKDQLKRISRRHDLVLMRVGDQRDSHFPAIGLVQLQDPETGQSVVVDTSNASLRKMLEKKHGQWRQQHDQSILQSKASLLELATGDDVTRELIKFFHKRRRR